MKELLLLLCRYPYDESHGQHLSNLLGEVKDWHKMVELINAHGIIALAAYNIKEAGLEKKIPEEAMTFLQNGYLQSVVRNTWLTERWKEVNAILCEAGIKHILLKGMALEHTIYGSKGLRQMSDNDILINQDDSFRAWQLLQQNGFMLEPFKSPLFRKIIFAFGRHLPALTKNGYVVEIHNELFDNKNKEEFSHNNPFNDAIEIVIGGNKALILSEKLQLMHLIKHYNDHALAGNCQLRLFADILLFDDNTKYEFPDRFISDPIQENKKEFLKAAYKSNLCSIAPKNRWRFIIGDIFPSVKWMKKRYKCNGVKAMFYYPLRIGKLMWLIGRKG